MATNARGSNRKGRASHAPRWIEPLERRLLLSAAVEGTSNAASKVFAHTNVISAALSPSASSPPGSAMTPSLMRHAYGLDQVMFGSASGDGTGQIVAIVDAFHYPTAFNDLSVFSTQFSLPLLNQYTGPSTPTPYFRQVAQDGSTNFPANDTTGGWELEEALDIEWVHSMAPMASIILVEATTNSLPNLIQNAANWARSQPGVVAVSMSFGGGEFKHPISETTFDTYFTTPTGHSGVSFFAATGDNGSPGSYPAYSPNVVAVGGTSLTLSNGNYGSESGWSGSGGGISSAESQPSYQNGVVTQSNSRRCTPDVSIDADPNIGGVAVYDTFLQPGGPWLQVGGTSLSTPLWAAMAAIVDQGLALIGQGPLDGRTQLLPQLYQLPAGDFHDVISGSNGGFSAGPGYDLVTGRGTPVANLLIPDLIGANTVSGTAFVDANSSGTLDAGETPLSGTTVFLDTNGNGSLDPGETSTVTNSNGAYAFYLTYGPYNVRAIVPAGYIATTPVVFNPTVAAAATVLNFGSFPTTFGASAGPTLYVRLDAGGTNLQIFSGNSAQGTPAYQIALAALPALTFNLAAAGSLYLDFSNGAPLPTGSISVHGTALAGDALYLIGASPAQSFNVTDFLITPTGGPAISYSGLDILHLVDGTFLYSGTLSTLQQLFIDNLATLVWS